MTTTQDTSGISLDIQTLSQAYWGQSALDLLRASGRVSVTYETQYLRPATFLTYRTASSQVTLLWSSLKGR